MRLIRKIIECYDQVEESWEEVFKKSNSDIIEDLTKVVRELYGAKPKNQYCHLGKGTSMYYVSRFLGFLTPHPPLSSKVSICHDPPLVLRKVFLTSPPCKKMAKLNLP